MSAVAGEPCILVTGADGAVGSAVVDCFLARGHRVVGVHRPGSTPRRALPGLTWYPLDGKSAESVAASLATIRATEGPVGTLLHCAGSFRYAPIESTSDADFDLLVDANLRSAFQLLRALVPEMKQRNHGRIVLVSARSALAPTAGVSVYTATKAALNALVAAVADEVRPFDITINAVAPTVIDTPANRRDMPDADFSKWVSTAQLAAVIHGLATEFGRPIHGAIVPVAGRL